MATMPKCSGPTAWTRGTSWPLGFCKTKVLRGLVERACRRRGMGSSFREEDRSILNPKGRVGKEREFFFSANPHTMEQSVTADRWETAQTVSGQSATGSTRWGGCKRPTPQKG